MDSVKTPEESRQDAKTHSDASKVKGHMIAAPVCWSRSTDRHNTYKTLSKSKRHLQRCRKSTKTKKIFLASEYKNVHQVGLQFSASFSPLDNIHVFDLPIYNNLCPSRDFVALFPPVCRSISMRFYYWYRFMYCKQILLKARCISHRCR